MKVSVKGMVLAAMCAAGVFCARSADMASQPWVKLKISQSEESLRAYIDSKASSVSPEQIASAVASYISAHAAEFKGKDGQSVTDAQIVSAVTSYIMAHVAMFKGEDGQNVTDEQVAAAVTAYIAAHPDEFKGADASTEQVAGVVADYMSDFAIVTQDDLTEVRTNLEGQIAAAAPSDYSEVRVQVSANTAAISRLASAETTATVSVATNSYWTSGYKRANSVPDAEYEWTYADGSDYETIRYNAETKVWRLTVKNGSYFGFGEKTAAADAETLAFSVGGHSYTYFRTWLYGDVEVAYGVVYSGELNTVKEALLQKIDESAPSDYETVKGTVETNAANISSLQSSKADAVKGVESYDYWVCDWDGSVLDLDGENPALWKKGSGATARTLEVGEVGDGGTTNYTWFLRVGSDYGSPVQTETQGAKKLSIVGESGKIYTLTRVSGSEANTVVYSKDFIPVKTVVETQMPNKADATKITYRQGAATNSYWSCEWSGDLLYAEPELEGHWTDGNVRLYNEYGANWYLEVGGSTEMAFDVGYADEVEEVSFNDTYLLRRHYLYAQEAVVNAVVYADSLAAKADATKTVGANTYSVVYSDTTAALQGSVNGINSVIPSDASASNKLVDRSSLNEAILSASACYRGAYDSWSDVPTNSTDYVADTSGTTTPSANDYLTVLNASDFAKTVTIGGASVVTNLTGVWRFKYSGTWSEQGKAGWRPEYEISANAMTQPQLAALNSGVTAEKVATYDGRDANVATMLRAIATTIDTDKLDNVQDIIDTLTQLKTKLGELATSLESGE